MDLETMEQIQTEKLKETAGREPMALDAEGSDLAEEKRYSIDLPETVVKTDPLR